MQNGGVVRLAHSILARPCCVLQICPTSTEGMRHAWEQCFFSTSTTARHPTVSATTAESLNTSDSQRGAAGTKHAEKVVHANNLRRLRKKWQAQHAEQLAIKAKAAAKKAANIAVTQEGHRRNLAALKQLRAQIHEEKQRLQLAELAQRQNLAAEFRATTQHIYSQLKDQRREELLAQSKAWITPETVDARIEAALENPIILDQSAVGDQLKADEDF